MILEYDHDGYFAVVSFPVYQISQNHSRKTVSYLTNNKTEKLEFTKSSEYVRFVNWLTEHNKEYA